MVHACLPCASLRRCGKVVSDDAVSDWKSPLSCSMLFSGRFLPLSTPPLSLLLFFSPRSSLPATFFALTLERYSFIPTIVCLLCFISLRNSWAFECLGRGDNGITWELDTIWLDAVDCSHA